LENMDLIGVASTGRGAGRSARQAPSALQHLRRELDGVRLYEFETTIALQIDDWSVTRVLIPAMAQSEALTLVNGISWSVPLASCFLMFRRALTNDEVIAPALMLTKAGLAGLANPELNDFSIPVHARLQAFLDLHLSWTGQVSRSQAPDYVLITAGGGRHAGVFDGRIRPLPIRRERRGPRGDTGPWGRVHPPLASPPV
jgi:hypothetical protein